MIAPAEAGVMPRTSADKLSPLPAFPGLRRDEKGDWWVDTRINGQRRRKKVGKSFELAKTVLHKMKETGRRDKLFPEEAEVRKRQLTLEQLCDRYRQEDTNNNANWRKHALYERYWMDFLGKGVLITSITPADVERYKAMRQKGGSASEILCRTERQRQRQAKPRSASTINKEVKRLLRLFNLACKDRILQRNPLDRIEMMPGEVERIRYLLDSEERALRGVMEPEDWLMVEFAFRTGLRQAEQFAMLRSEVDLDHHRLHIPWTKNGERRDIPINKDLARKLKAHLDTHDSAWVWPSEVGTAMNALNFYKRVFRPAVAKAKIRNLVWHDLRHTFASRLVMKSEPLLIVSYLMGHKSIQQTSKYAHLDPNHAGVSAVEKI